MLRHRIHALVVSLCITCAPASAGWAKDASRIELADGTVYENVTYRISQEFKVVTIKLSGEDRNVSFGDIVAISDSDGNDITTDVIGERRATTTIGQEPAISGDSATPPAPAPRPIPRGREYPYAAAIHLSPNFSIPAGRFYDGFTGGFGYGGEITIPVSRQIAIRGTVSRSGMKPEHDVSDGVSYRVWRYYISVQYYEWPKWRSGGQTMYYIFSGIGAAEHVASFGSIKDNLTKVMTATGIGVLQRLSESIGIEAGGEFDIVYVGSSGSRSSFYGDVEYAYLFDFKCGLVVLF